MSDIVNTLHIELLATPPRQSRPLRSGSSESGRRITAWTAPAMRIRISRTHATEMSCQLHWLQFLTAKSVGPPP